MRLTRVSHKANSSCYSVGCTRVMSIQTSPCANGTTCTKKFGASFHGQLALVCRCRRHRGNLFRKLFSRAPAILGFCVVDRGRRATRCGARSSLQRSICVWTRSAAFKIARYRLGLRRAMGSFKFFNHARLEVFMGLITQGEPLRTSGASRPRLSSVCLICEIMFTP